MAPGGIGASHVEELGVLSVKVKYRCVSTVGQNDNENILTCTSSLICSNLSYLPTVQIGTVVDDVAKYSAIRMTKIRLLLYVEFVSPTSLGPKPPIRNSFKWCKFGPGTQSSTRGPIRAVSV